MIFPKADLHVHPFLKPYGHSFYPNNNPDDAYSGASPWYRDPNTIKDDGVENVLGFSPYRQSDFASCKRGNVRLVINSHYPMEQGFLDVKDKPLLQAMDKLIGKKLANAITEFGKEWITIIRSSSYNYYEDLLGQMEFSQQFHFKVPMNGTSKYRIINSGEGLDEALVSGDLLVINTIEGAQAFCNGNNPANAKQWEGVEERIALVKQHPGKPFFVTLAHHFYNGLCSHSESLFDLKKIIKGQQLGMGTLKDPPLSYHSEITDLGYKVIDSLLSSANGAPVLIDVKHMSKKARTEYYAYRKQKYNHIPIIYSHGACQVKYPYEINLDENDIIEITASGGLIGIELDQRILGYNEKTNGKRFGKWFKNIFRKDAKQDMAWGLPLWENLIHIAETNYRNGFTDDPWQSISIGSDYDGIINPLNEFRTIDTLGDLCTVIRKYLEEYWSKPGSLIPPLTGGDETDIVYRIGFKNVFDFVKIHFR